MYKRLGILTAIIIVAFALLGWLGYRSIVMMSDGMRGRRQGEFASVSEQIRLDLKSKLDRFIQREQQRPYIHYQYDYVPEVAAGFQQDAGPVLRSPLGERLQMGFAYGYFQIEPDGTVTTPYYIEGDVKKEQIESGLYGEASSYVENIKDKLAAKINTVDYSRPVTLPLERDRAVADAKKKDMDFAKKVPRKSKSLPIESLQSKERETQVFKQQRSVVTQNIDRWERSKLQYERAQQQEIAKSQAKTDSTSQRQQDRLQEEYKANRVGGEEESGEKLEQPRPEQGGDTVQVRIEPFAPIVVKGEKQDCPLFGSDVFLIRHVQVGARHFVQGFKLAQEQLLEDFKSSAELLMRPGMSFEISAGEDKKAAYAAVLDFGIGQLVLNLFEDDPGWISSETRKLRNWYFSIMGVVFAAIGAGLVSLWLSAHAQTGLSRKKDDFISAVSHELRTPLTSMRMYAEMLDKGWVKSAEKVREYYGNMRQETERLTRLVENVLDFSRIQKGRKKYQFAVGDVDDCVKNTVEMMAPYAERNGFSIDLRTGCPKPVLFDKDAVTQILVNLLDNAVKYAREAEDKRILVRTTAQKDYVLIEVEDHGPGIGHRQKKKVFGKFYRIGPEATRQTSGSGLGLAIVESFAQAHRGFVEILNAKPRGAIFRVGLAVSH